MLPLVELYTDGSTIGNPGVGGWGAVLLYQDSKEFYTKEISGSSQETTNNRMELTAVIEGLNALKCTCDVIVYSDSQYVVYAHTKGRIKHWQADGWLRKGDKKVPNSDLWQELLQVEEKHHVKFVWVRGHKGNVLNERCDKLAKQAARKAS